MPGSIVMLVLTVMLAVAMETQALYFATCWGWGPGCSRHENFRHPVRVARPAEDSPGGADIPIQESRSPPRPASGTRRRPAYMAHSGRGIPSIVTSGGWEPGFMGKRDFPTARSDLGIDPQQRRSLMQLLQFQHDPAN